MNSSGENAGDKSKFKPQKTDRNAVQLTLFQVPTKLRFLQGLQPEASIEEA